MFSAVVRDFACFLILFCVERVCCVRALRAFVACDCCVRWPSLSNCNFWNASSKSNTSFLHFTSARFFSFVLFNWSFRFFYYIEGVFWPARSFLVDTKIFSEVLRSNEISKFDENFLFARLWASLRVFAHLCAFCNSSFYCDSWQTSSFRSVQ